MSCPQASPKLPVRRSITAEGLMWWIRAAAQASRRIGVLLIQRRSPSWMRVVGATKSQQALAGMATHNRTAKRVSLLAINQTPPMAMGKPPSRQHRRVLAEI